MSVHKSLTSLLVEKKTEKGRKRNQVPLPSFPFLCECSVALYGWSRIPTSDRRQYRIEHWLLICRLPTFGCVGLGVGCRSLIERQSRDDATNLDRIERFALEQSLSQAIQSLPILENDPSCALVLLETIRFTS